MKIIRLIFKFLDIYQQTRTLIIFLWLDSCGYWDWYDDEMCEYFKQVIPSFLSRVNRLETKNEASRD